MVRTGIRWRYLRLPFPGPSFAFVCGGVAHCHGIRIVNWRNRERQKALGLLSDHGKREQASPFQSTRAWDGRLLLHLEGE